MIECVPLDSLEIVKLALPELSALLPRVLLPSLKVTVPVGVAVPGAPATTVAVNVTAWLRNEGFSDEIRVVVVLSVLTVSPSDGEVLVFKFALPP